MYVPSPSTLPQIKFPPSKKQIILLSLIAVILIVASIIYSLTSLWTPEQSLLTLLPDAPICYVSVKELGGLIRTFQRSEFGGQTAQMPILEEVQRELWWRQMVYQKRLWEYEMGGKLDLKKIKGYFGEEAILSVYKRGGEISFLLISAVGAKEKLEIATLTATARVNPNYKRLKENYRGMDINTITGYPKDFSYAFMGKIGLLTTDKSLIRDTIDIHAKQKQGFTNHRRIGNFLRAQYNRDGNTLYIDAPRFAQVFPFGEPLKSLSEGINTWTFSNHYERGIIHSRHRLLWNANRQFTQDNQSPSPMDKHLLSILPAATALLSVSSNAAPKAMWEQMNANLPLQYPQGEVDLSRHLKPGIALALLAPPTDTPVRTPSILLICPIRDRAGLEAELIQLQQQKITLNDTPLEFLDPQNYQGISFQPVQLRLGFLLSLKGGYALLDDYWVIGTTVSALKSAIGAFAQRETALADTVLPAQLERPSDRHLLIQPNLFIPELKRLIPIAGLIASASGVQIDPKLITRITNNLFPLEALGMITAGVNFDGEFVDAEIQIVLEE
ncbi:MAG: hypothetical protein O7E52_14560 [Candidatus Poribacteria bacterium]|nr:hypothetical protein [Candidatus Poribacteria bacterium]